MQVLWSLYGPGELLPIFLVRYKIVAARYRTLRDLAEKAGHSPASLADALGVDETTIYRHWVADDWLDRMQSHAIRKLMAVVPGIDQEYSRSVVQERVDQLIKEGAAAGFEISGAAFSQAIEQAAIVPQFLCSATEAGLSILKGDTDRSVRKLRSCWGRPQTWALHAIYGSAGTPPVFPDHQALIGASREMFEKLSSTRITYQRSIALGHLAHHLAAQIEMDIKSPARRRAGLRDEMAGFFVRGAFMGSLRRSDDLDLAGRYNELVATEGAARLVELWTFPSWTGDLSPSADNFTLPHNCRGARPAGTPRARGGRQLAARCSPARPAGAGEGDRGVLGSRPGNRRTVRGNHEDSAHLPAPLPAAEARPQDQLRVGRAQQRLSLPPL